MSLETPSSQAFQPHQMTTRTTSTHTYRLSKLLKIDAASCCHSINERAHYTDRIQSVKRPAENYFLQRLRSLFPERRRAFYRMQSLGQGVGRTFLSAAPHPGIARIYLAQRNPRELALAHLRHHSLAACQLQCLVDNLFTIQLDPTLLYHAQGLRGTGNQ